MSQFYQQSPGIELEQMGGETVLLNVGTSRFCLLNPTAAFLWERLKQPATKNHLVSEICQSFSGGAAESVLEDVEKVISELSENGFIVSTQEG